jgi:hypothetical protein
VPNEIVIEAMIKGLRPGPTTQYFARKPPQTLEKLKIAQAKAKSQVEAETGQAEAEATQAQAEAEAGPSMPTETEPVAPEEKTVDQIAPEKIEAPAPKALIENIDYIIRHASGKKLPKGEIMEARHYARKNEISEGSLGF